MSERSPKGWKTLLEKEKLLIKSNFFFSNSVFKRLELQACKNQGLFGKGLKTFFSEAADAFISTYFHMTVPHKIASRKFGPVENITCLNRPTLVTQASDVIKELMGL